MAETKEVAIKINDLTFSYPGRPPVLKNLNMSLEAGSRCLLIGANGAGKSTLLRILSGRHKTNPDESVVMLGKSCFFDTRLNFERAYLDTDWGMRTVAFAGYGCPLQADIPVHGMMTKLQNDYPERRDELIELLGIDVNWRMHQVSDGQRRRVQIFIGLLRPFKVLLLDEVTISLDVVVRQDLLRWLRTECETRGATILYATHIFDGLDDWPTHVHYLSNHGSTGWSGELPQLQLYQEMRSRGEPSPLLRIAEFWLRAEIAESKRLAKERHDQSDKELPNGTAAQLSEDPRAVSFVAAGGFSNGRMAAYDFIGTK